MSCNYSNWVKKSKYQELEDKYKKGENCEKPDYSNYILKSEHQRALDSIDSERKSLIGERNILQTRIKSQQLSNSKLQDTMNSYLAASKITNSIAEKYIGDFKNYLGKWFMICSNVDQRYHLSTRGRHNGGGQVVITTDNNKANDLFTVDPYGHIICYSNLNTVLAAVPNKTRVQVDTKTTKKNAFIKTTETTFENRFNFNNGAGIYCVSVNDQNYPPNFMHWTYQKGRINLAANNAYGWDLSGHNQVSNDKPVQLWSVAGDDYKDRFWTIKVVEAFQPSQAQIDTIAKVVALVVFCICVYFLLKSIYGDEIKNLYIRAPTSGGWNDYW